MLMQAAKGKRNVGAPVKFGPRYDIATYLFVEERRALIAKRNLAKPTIANAIESLNEEIANDEGCRKLDYTKEFRYHTRSSYQRGKRLVEADQNPK
jgi:hypothetical protein